MVNFILQEAHEKANEIRVKTEHDFNVEKQTLIHAARQRLNAQLRKELAAAKAPRAAFYAAHRSCLAPFTSGKDLDALTKKAQPLPDRVARVLVQPEAIKAELRDYQLQSLDWSW